MNTAIAPIRIGLAQVNPTVGNLSGNRELILKFARHAKSGGAHIVLFPEMVLTGYPVEDLAMRPSFRDGSRRAINELALALAGSEFEDLVSVVGYLDESESGSPQNAIAIIYRGEIKARYIKHHLPNYGVFDEFRNFTPGNKSLIARIHGIDVGFAICQDIWEDGGPVAELANRGAGLLLVPNGSPYEKAKDDKRLELASRRAREVGAPLVYVNMVGGQDDLVFDGDSIVVDAGGKLIARSPQFVEGLALVDLEARLGSADPDLVITDIPIAKYEKLKVGKVDPLDGYGEIWEALVLGLKDYVTKNGFKSVALGLSGGIDSALVAAIAVDALGPQAVHAIALPSRYSSTHSLEDALALALNTGLNYRVISIEPMVTAYLNSINLDGLAEENLQARVRGTTLMGLSNQPEINLSWRLGTQRFMAMQLAVLRRLKIFLKLMYGTSLNGEMIKRLSAVKHHLFQLTPFRKNRALNFVRDRKILIRCRNTQSSTKFSQSILRKLAALMQSLRLDSIEL